jgi:hypothetical protein
LGQASTTTANRVPRREIGTPLSTDFSQPHANDGACKSSIRDRSFDAPRLRGTLMNAPTVGHVQTSFPISSCIFSLKR